MRWVSDLAKYDELRAAIENILGTLVPTEVKPDQAEGASHYGKQNLIVSLNMYLNPLDLLTYNSGSLFAPFCRTS